MVNRSNVLDCVENSVRMLSHVTRRPILLPLHKAIMEQLKLPAKFLLPTFRPGIHSDRLKIWMSSVISGNHLMASSKMKASLDKTWNYNCLLIFFFLIFVF